MSVDARQVKELRDRTGAGMMDCKRALADTSGDIDAAIALLREKGLAGAAKKAGRIASEGLVGVFTNDASTQAVLVELNCETDFVAKTEQFEGLLSEIGAALLSAKVGDVGGAEEAGAVKTDGGSTISERLKGAIASIGENISLRRLQRMTASSGSIGSYVHAGGKIGVLEEVAGANESDAEILKSLAMQVAAAFPRYVRREEVAADEVEKERDIYRAQAASSGKPANVIERIVDGKLDKYFREVCLLEQDYVRDPDLTIQKYLAQSGKAAGRELSIVRFARYQLGEGLERKESNLAEEVAAQLAQG